VNRRVAVVGGGISGLAAAHHLLELAAGPVPLDTSASDLLDVQVFEAAPRAGGIIRTVREGALVLEEGPDSFITDKPEALALVRRLGLDAQVQGTRPAFRQSFVVRGGRLVPTPAGFQLLAPSRLGPVFASPLFSPLGKLRIALERFIPARRADTGDYDESLASFVTRRLGREALERIAQPMVGGIYGADPAELSLAATFPRFLALEREFGSVTRGLAQTRSAAGDASGARYGLFASLEGGLGTLVDALLARLPEGALRSGTEVTALAPLPGGGWSVRANDTEQRFDAVVLALPAAAAGAIARGFDPALGGALGAFTAGSSVTLSLAYRAAAIADPLVGAGFVVPSGESAALDGVIGGSFTHRKFERRAPEDTALVRLFFGEDALTLADEDLARRGHDALARLVRATEPPRARHVARWPQGMPHYRVGHKGRVDAAFEAARRHRGLALAGNSYTGVGIPDCVRSGESAARDAFAALAGGD
jgi:oxygen-dependent protoporphyrinogen oxidase